MPQVIDIKNKISPSDYSKDSKYNDILLVELDRPVDITRGFVRPLCLPTIGLKSSNDKYFIIGWGSVNQTAVRMATSN